MRFAIRILAGALLACAAAASPVQAQTTALPALSHSLTAIDPRTDAPGFRLVDMEGKAHDLAQYRGKVVLVNFWATWCPPCRREMPSLERLQRKLGARSFVVLAVNVGETVDMIFPFLGTLDTQPTFPILLDQDSKVLKSWPVKGLPTTFILDRSGRLSRRAIGGREFDHPEVVKTIEKLIGER